MNTMPAPTASAPQPEPLSGFLARYEQVLQRIFRSPVDGPRRHLVRGLPPSELREMLATRPLSVFVPASHGGRGGHVAEGLAMLETTGYESLAMALTLGINGALFLQPVAKYAAPEVQTSVFERFLEHQNMGGLMMTEPGHGSDALGMRTAWTHEEGGYRIRGTKHWAGLTGLADYWLMLARERGQDGELARDVGFFVLDTHRPEQAVVVEERFENLGLYPIPYGRNRVDVHAPSNQKLASRGSGLKMMLDLLHRSRVQFPGMALGFLRRLSDEAVSHVRERKVGGHALEAYDQVQRRLARLQASATVASAMCVFSSARASLEGDLSKLGLAANVVKADVTDRMHEGAQSLLQLVGAKGYRLDHIAGRSVVDARPFQIFEGSNDILYEQIATTTLKAMRRAGQARLDVFLGAHELTSRAADHLRSVLNVRIDGELPQRRRVDFGRVVAKIAAMDMVVQLGDLGYPAERVRGALAQLRSEIEAAFTSFHRTDATEHVDDELGGGAWLSYTAGT